MAANDWMRRLQRANVWFAAAVVAFFFVLGVDLIVRAIAPHPPGVVLILILVVVTVVVHRVIQERGAD